MIWQHRPCLYMWWEGALGVRRSGCVHSYAQVSLRVDCPVGRSVNMADFTFIYSASKSGCLTATAPPRRCSCSWGVNRRAWWSLWSQRLLSMTVTRPSCPCSSAGTPHAGAQRWWTCLRKTLQHFSTRGGLLTGSDPRAVSKAETCRSYAGPELDLWGPHKWKDTQQTPQFMWVSPIILLRKPSNC